MTKYLYGNKRNGFGLRADIVSDTFHRLTNGVEMEVLLTLNSSTLDIDFLCFN